MPSDLGLTQTPLVESPVIQGLRDAWSSPVQMAMQDGGQRRASRPGGTRHPGELSGKLAQEDRQGCTQTLKGSRSARSAKQTQERRPRGDRGEA